MGRRIALDGAGQFLQLGSQSLKLSGQCFGIDLAKIGRGVEQRVEHHRNAWQDRFLDPLERLLEARLLLLDITHAPKHGANAVKKP